MHKSDKSIIIFGLLIIGRIEHIFGDLWLQGTRLLLSILIIFIVVIEFGDIRRRRSMGRVLCRLRFDETFDWIDRHALGSHIRSILIFRRWLISFFIIFLIICSLI